MLLNPNLFFLLKKGKIIVWNYENHQQFVLERAYFDRLQEWSHGEPLEKIPLDEELRKAHLLVENEQSVWGWDLLSHIFHIGTSNISDEVVSPEQWVDLYLNFCRSIAEAFPEGRQRTISHTLPSHNPELLQGVSLLNVIYERKTCRSFHGMAMTLDQLSTLLYYSFGQIHAQWPDMKGMTQLGIRKAFPSGGGLHPEEVYLIVLRVEGLDPGVYYYHSQDHYLSLIESGCFEEKMIDLLGSQFYAQGLAVGIFLSSRFDKIWWKYKHSRGYRVALLDAGHASQTFLLTATALGLNTWLTGAFSDQGVKELLQIQDSSEHPLFFVGAGHGSNDSLHPKLRPEVGHP